MTDSRELAAAERGPRYITYVDSRQFYCCETLVQAMDCKAAFGGMVYEPLAMSACERIAAEPVAGHAPAPADAAGLGRLAEELRKAWFIGGGPDLSMVMPTWLAVARKAMDLCRGRDADFSFAQERVAAVEYSIGRLIAWLESSPRRPAAIAFTSGPERQLAYRIEDALGRDAGEAGRELWECPDCGFEMHNRHFREPGEGEDYHACPACGELALRERLRRLAEAAMPLQLWIEARRWVANESVLASVPISPQERNGHDMTFGELRNILAALVPAPEAGRG